MKVPGMAPADLQAFIRQPTVAKLATLSAKGQIRITPIWFRAEPDGSFLIATWAKTAAAKNITANPGCSLLIDQENAEPYWGVHYTGTATIEGPSNDLEGIAQLYLPYRSDIEAVRKDVGGLIEESEMVYIRFRPDNELSWDFREE